MNAARQQVEKYVLDVMKDLDKSGKEVKRYQEFFASLTDAAFDQWMKNLRDHKEVLLSMYHP